MMIIIPDQDVKSRAMEASRAFKQQSLYSLFEGASPISRISDQQSALLSALETAVAAYTAVYDSVERKLDTTTYKPDTENFRLRRVFANRYGLYIGSEIGLRMLHGGEIQHDETTTPLSMNLSMSGTEINRHIATHFSSFFKAGIGGDSSEEGQKKLIGTYLQSMRNTAFSGMDKYEVLFNEYPAVEEVSILGTDFARFSVKGKKKTKKLTFADYSGQEKVVAQLKQVASFVRNPRPFMMWGGEISTGVLLVGPPGTGKTYLARVFADEVDAPFFEIKISDILNSYYGESSRNVQRLLSRPGIIFMDEMESLGRKVGDSNTFEATEQIVNTMKQVMDGFDDKARGYGGEITFYIGATNSIEIMEPALIRPGRLKPLFMEGYSPQGLAHVIEITQRAIVKKATGERKVFEDFDQQKMDALGKQLSERALVPADIDHICKSLALDRGFQQEQAGTSVVLPPISYEEINEAITKYERSDDAVAKNVLSKLGVNVSDLQAQ
jgi:hypothetical protein